MSGLAWFLTGWGIASPLLGVLIGRAIRLRDQRRLDRPPVRGGTR